MTDFITKALHNASPVFNDTEMSISGWLSAPTVDLDDEIVDGTAFDCTRHKANPVMLWHHKRDQLPIGKYEDANGNYTLRAKAYPGGGSGLYGTAYLSKANPEGPVIYGMYREGTLRGFSAGFMPKRSSVEKANGRNVRRFTEAELWEGSSTPIGANPEAVAKALRTGKVNGDRIPTHLAADLRMLLPKRKYFMVGGQVKKSDSAFMHATQQSLKTLTRTDMPDAAKETAPETPVAYELPETVTKSLDELNKFHTDAVPVLNELQELVTKQAAQINEFEAKLAGYVPRDEYDADTTAISKAIATVSAGGKVTQGN